MRIALAFLSVFIGEGNMNSYCLGRVTELFLDVVQTVFFLCLSSFVFHYEDPLAFSVWSSPICGNKQ